MPKSLWVCSRVKQTVDSQRQNYTRLLVSSWNIREWIFYYFLTIPYGDLLGTFFLSLVYFFLFQHTKNTIHLILINFKTLIYGNLSLALRINILTGRALISHLKEYLRNYLRFPKITSSIIFNLPNGQKHWFAKLYFVKKEIWGKII